MHHASADQRCETEAYMDQEGGQHVSPVSSHAEADSTIGPGPEHGGWSPMCRDAPQLLEPGSDQVNSSYR